ncbi:MAG: pseudouridine synthase [Proteobacteria bacterium]|nr:pseudouridine synthase [Pseudomonadota bacterium]
MPDAWILNKPYGVLCQFSASGARATLADYVHVPDVYPAGRLDADSEGLVVLTADGPLQARLAHPRHKVAKTYYVQVEGTPGPEALDRLARGVELAGFVTQPAEAAVIAEPHGLWPRTPPIRARRAIPTAWLALTLREGKNRQVRRMTAAVGLPTLRLVRWRVGDWTLDGLAPGEVRKVRVLPFVPSGASPRASAPAPFARRPRSSRMPQR